MPRLVRDRHACALRAAVGPLAGRDLLPGLRAHVAPLLRATGVGTKTDLRTDRFEVTRNVAGERALVLDDTFTRGPTLFSAVAALRDAGASVVGPVVLGRHINPGWGPSQVLLSWLGDRTWDEARCCRCDGEHQGPVQTALFG